MFCPKCGYRLETEETVICPGCGLDLKQFEQEGKELEAAAQAKQDRAKAAEAAPAAETVQPEPVPDTAGQPVPEQAAMAQSVPEQTTEEQGEPLPPKKKFTIPKMNPVAAVLSVILCVVMLVAVCAVIFRIASGGRVVRIPLNDYLTVTFEGYEGQGEAIASFDEDRFLADYSGRIKLTGKGKKLEEAGTEIGSAVMMLSEGEIPANILLLLFENGSLSPSSGLKNGDETVFSWNLTDSVKQELKDYLGCVPEAPDLVLYAEGLDDVRPVDLFEGLTLRFTGGASNGMAEIDQPSASEFAGELDFVAEPAEGLQNGDTVTVTVTYGGEHPDAYLAETYGVRAQETQKEFTVEGLSNYAESYEDITDEIIRRMDQKAMSMIEDYFDSDPEAFGNSELTPIGALFLKAQDPEADPEFYNGVVMLYQAAVMVTAWEDGQEYTGRADYYTYVTFRNIETDEFGASNVDLETAELTPTSFVFNIPGTELVLEDGSIDWLTHDLRGFATLDEMILDCDNRFGYDYDMTEYLEGDLSGLELPQQDTETGGDTEDSLQYETGPDENPGTLEEEIPEEGTDDGDTTNL